MDVYIDDASDFANLIIFEDKVRAFLRRKAGHLQWIWVHWMSFSKRKDIVKRENSLITTVSAAAAAASPATKD